MDQESERPISGKSVTGRPRELTVRVDVNEDGVPWAVLTMGVGSTQYEATVPLAELLSAIAKGLPRPE